MQLTVLISAFLLPAVSLTHDPSPLLADDGRDLSFLLKRYDGPVPILHQAVKGKRHIVPRTLQVEQVQVSRAFNGLLERHECPDAGTVVCPSNTQCCPEGSVCGPGFCCPSGNLACTGNCKVAFSFLRLSLRSRTSRSSGCPDSLGDCCPNVGCCKAGHVSVCNSVNDKSISDSVFHRPASLRLMERLVAALAVQTVLPSMVSGSSKHNSGSPLKPPST